MPLKKCEIAADVDRMLETQFVENTSPFLPDRPGTPPEIVTTLATDNAEIDRQSLRFTLSNEFGALSHDVAVEATAMTANTGDNEIFNFLSLALLQ